MNVKDFEYMVELGKCGSISKASRALYISQPALSKFIQKMETEAGTPLFQHVGRHLVPTYAGEQCIQTAQQILYLHDQLMHSLSDIAQQKSGQIKLGLPMSRSNYFISQILPLFYQQYPHICINIYEDNTRNLLKKVRSGELNLIFINMSENHEDLTYQIVSEEEMVLAAPANYHLQEKAFSSKSYRFPCLSPEAWKDYPFLMLNEDQMSRKFADQYLEKNHIVPHTLLKIRNLGQVLYSVQQGLGVTICPAMPIVEEASAEKVSYFSLLSDTGPIVRKTAIVFRKDAYLSAAEKLFIQIILNHYNLTPAKSF